MTTATTKSRACRNCGSDRIRSVDRYVGTCAGTFQEDGTWEPDGYTEIHWDSCEQIGWDCADCDDSEERQEPDGVNEPEPFDLAAMLNKLAPMTAPDPLAELREECGYDPDGDTGVDSLIDYKDALEGEYLALLAKTSQA